MAEVTGNWGDAVRGIGVEYREFITHRDLSLTDGWSPIVETISDNAAQATFSGKTGAGILTRFSEGATIPKKLRYKLYDTAFVHNQYGGQIEVSRLQLMNRSHGEAFDEFRDLVSSGAVLRSKAPAQIFNGAFATTTDVNSVKITTYGDGKPLASTIHPRVDGGTAQSNASATGITLTESNLETARVALLEQLQDDGVPLTNFGELYLVVPTALDKTARIITESNLRSATTDNDINIYSGGAVKVMSSHWLGATNGGSDTQWFLVAPSVARLMFVQRTAGESDMTVNSNTKSVLFDYIMDFSVGSIDWRGFWASKGDGAAYSS